MSIDSIGPRRGFGARVSRVLDRIGFRPDVDVTVGGLWRGQRSLRSARAEAALRQRDATTLRHPVDAPAADAPHLPQVDRLLDDAALSPATRDAFRLIDDLCRAPGNEHLAALSVGQRRSVALALLRACETSEPTVIHAAADALVTMDLEREAAPMDDRDADARLCAWRTIRLLAAAGGSGAQAAALVGSTDASTVAAIVKACDALDPTRERTITELITRARYVERRVAAEAAGDIAGWRSPQQAIDAGVAPEVVRDRLPSIALIALTCSGANGTATLSPVQKAAVALVANGLAADAAGSDLAFAQGRLAKLGTYARRLEGGWLRRLGNAIRHKNPLAPLVDRGLKDKPRSALETMRATRAAAGSMGALFGAVAGYGGRLGAVAGTGIERDAAYRSALYAHWSRRAPATQQLDRRLEGREPFELIRAIRASGHEVDEAAIARFESMASRQTLDPLALQRDGWDLVGYLRDAARLVAADTHGDPLPDEDRARVEPAWGLVERIVHGAPEDAATPRAAAPHREPDGEVFHDALESFVHEVDGDVFHDALESSERHRAFDATLRHFEQHVSALEDDLLRLDPGQSDAIARDPERQRALDARAAAPGAPGTGADFATRAARRNDPIGCLAHAVRDFRAGSSVTLANGRCHGVNVPSGLPLAIASFFLPLPVTGAGRMACARRKEAVTSVKLDHGGGEIFLGTTRIADWELTGGAVVGLSAGPVAVGVGGVVGSSGKVARSAGVRLRISRDAILAQHPELSQPGAIDPAVDRAIAARLSEVLTAVGEACSGDRGPPLMQLMARFPELSVSVSRDADERLELAPLTLRAEAGAGVYVPVYPTGARALGTGVTAKVPVGAVVEHGERLGTSSLQQWQETAGGLKVEGEVNAAGWLPGSRWEAFAARMPLAQRGRTTLTSVVRSEGRHSPNSHRMTATTNRLQFEQAVGAALPELVDHALTSDARRRALSRDRIEHRDVNEVQARVQRDIRSEQAGRLLQGMNALPSSTDARYAILSLPRADALRALDDLDTLSSLSRGAPGQESVHATVRGEYRRIVQDPELFRPALAVQETVRTRKRSFGWRILLDARKTSRVDWTAVDGLL